MQRSKHILILALTAIIGIWSSPGLQASPPTAKGPAHSHSEQTKPHSDHQSGPGSEKKPNKKKGLDRAQERMSAQGLEHNQALNRSKQTTPPEKQSPAPRSENPKPSSVSPQSQTSQ